MAQSDAVENVQNQRLQSLVISLAEVPRARGTSQTNKQTNKQSCIWQICIVTD